MKFLQISANSFAAFLCCDTEKRKNDSDYIIDGMLPLEEIVKLILEKIS